MSAAVAVGAYVPGRAGRPSALGEFGFEGEMLAGRLKPLPALFPEEERSKQPSAFSILRALIEEFRGEEDSRLALVGAFGYDLLFQFEPIELKLPRDGHKDLHLFLCDDICFMDRKKEQIERFQYDFEREGVSHRGPAARRRETVPPPAPRARRRPSTRDHTPEEYMANVETVREGMRRGDYYEVVLRQTFRTPYSGKASRAVRAHADGQPQPLRIPAAVRRRATGGRVARNVRARGRRSAWRPARSPAPRGAPAIRCAMPRTSASC